MSGDGPAAGGGWSDAPADLLWTIINRLPRPDYIRFAAVCVSWREVLLQNRRLPAQLPLLILPESETTKFLTIPKNQNHHIDLPESITGVRKCIGSSDGWLIFADDVPALHLFDPLSGTHLRLPSVATLPFIVRDFGGYMVGGYMVGLKDIHESIFKKAVVSFRLGRFMVAAICSVPKKVAFARVGEDSWTVVDIPEVVVDIVFYKEQLYVLCQFGGVLAFDVWIDSSHRPRVIFMLPPPEDPSNCNFLFKYLAESSDGDLLQVWRQMKSFPENEVKVFVMRETVASKNVYYNKFWSKLKGLRDKILLFGFVCFQLVVTFVTKNFVAGKNVDNVGDNKCWDELKTLGDRALFLSYNHSVALPIKDFPELKRNCIYFTDNRHLNSYVKDVSECDLRVYNMENGKFSTYCPCEYQFNHPPFWFTPMLAETIVHRQL